MQSVGKIRSCILGDITFTGHHQHVHFLQCFYDGFAGIFIIKFFLEDPVEDQGCEAGNEMRCDPVFPAKVNRPCLKFAFHNPETFLDLPSFLVDAYNRRYFVLQVCTDGIKAIIPFFLPDDFFIDRRDQVVSDLTVSSVMVLPDKSFRIILCFPLQRRRIVRKLCGACKLPGTDTAMIIAILKLERYN